MHLSRSLIILLVCLGTQHSVLARDGRNLWEFSNMIGCTLPGFIPALHFVDYGCYCGFGGSGRPVDELDRCCQVHDNCYGRANRLPGCQSFLDSPYITHYKYRCDEDSKTVTCSRGNNACERFICECDREAVMCFANAPYHLSNVNISPLRCK